MSMKLSGFLVTGAAIMLAASATSTIADDTTDITVSAIIADACEFGTVTDIVFGEYTPGQPTALDKTGNMDVVCTASDLVTIAISGANPLNAGSLQMDDDNSNFVKYDIANPDGSGANWAAGPYLANFGNGTTPVPFTASMPSGQTPPAGNYSDTVTLTMTF